MLCKTTMEAFLSRIRLVREGGNSREPPLEQLADLDLFFSSAMALALVAVLHRRPAVRTS